MSYRRVDNAVKNPARGMTKFVKVFSAFVVARILGKRAGGGGGGRRIGGERKVRGGGGGRRRPGERDLDLDLFLLGPAAVLFCFLRARLSEIVPMNNKPKKGSKIVQKEGQKVEC